MLDAPDTFSVESAFWVLMAWFYRQARWEPEMLDSDEVVRFINAHADYLNKAITTSLEEGSLDDTAIQRLKESCYVFSGMKTFHELNEAFPMLTDSKGNLKPYSEFEQEVTAINDSYNKLYLRTEYNFAHASAQMASRWKAFEKDGDRYYLQYRTVGDSRVRESHRKLHNITLKIDSPFWDKYFPPNGFNCFQKGTKVLMFDGKWKNIEDVSKGDYVIGGSGNPKLVIGTHIKPFDGESVRIDTERGSASCTPNHRFLTSRGWVAASDIKAGDILIQVGKVSFLDKCINAIYNSVALIRKALMSVKRQR